MTACRLCKRPLVYPDDLVGICNNDDKCNERQVALLLANRLQSELVSGEWAVPTDGSNPSAIVSYTAEPCLETGHVGWMWWASGRTGCAPRYMAARLAAEEAINSGIRDRMAIL